MNKNVRWITQTALMLALLVTMQYLTKGFGQLVTGSCVNCLLALSVLLGGMACGVTIALCSPVLAFLLGIAPQIITVPAIIVGNVLYVLFLGSILGGEKKPLGTQAAALIVAALAKFAALYLIVVKLICGLAAPALLSAGVLKEPMLKMLPTMFSLPQLITALIGGAIALLTLPVLRKALKK